MNSKTQFFLLIAILSATYSYGQIDTIRLSNPSFEDQPKKGGVDNGGILRWFDCGKLEFPIESPPDIHPNGFWENNLPASDKNTYLGLVVRDNGTYEFVSQRLDKPMEAGNCYKFTIHLARAEKYVSLTRTSGKLSNYTTPVVLRIWGGNGLCDDRELLAESEPVSNGSWQINKFEFRPKGEIRSITLQAFYKTPVVFPYNGNLLLDGCSEIVQVACPGEAPLIAESNSKLPPHKRAKAKNTTKNNPVDKPIETASAPIKNSKPKILQELDRNKLKTGQTIEIKKLEFKADETSFNKESYEVLDEIYDFLKKHSEVVIEIGGHTNNVPTDEYCNKLSTARAKVVAEYLVEKGIDPNKVQFKGYGKKSPVADNKTAFGRQKNQRVEIKILSLES